MAVVLASAPNPRPSVLLGSRRLGALQTDGPAATLLDAQHARLIARLQAMLEAVAAPWADAPWARPGGLCPSGLDDRSRALLARWWHGEITGAHCMLSLLRTAPPAPTAPRPPLVALVPEALGLLVGLDTALGSGSLFTDVFAKPPGLVLQEGVAMLAREALDDADGLTAAQVNLAFRRAALRCLAAAPRDDPSVRGGPPTGDEGHLRLQILMELLRLHTAGVPFARRTEDPVPDHGGGSGDVVSATLLRPVAATEAEAAGYTVERLRADNGAVEGFTAYLTGLRGSLRQRLQRWEEDAACFALGVRPDAPVEELRRAYRARVLQAHPDKGGDAIAFQSLQDGYRLLLRRRRAPEAGAEAAVPPMGSAAADAVVADLDRWTREAHISAQQAALEGLGALQFGKAMAAAEGLGFPDAAEGLCTLVGEGAFRVALLAQQPTRTAACLTFDAMSAAMALVECGPAYRVAGCRHSLLDEVRQGMELGKLAVAAADEALKAHDGAGDILVMLSASLSMAQTDPEAHGLLVTVVTLRFQQLAAAADRCAHAACRAAIHAHRVRRIAGAVGDEAAAEGDAGRGGPDHNDGATSDTDDEPHATGGGARGAPDDTGGGGAEDAVVDGPPHAMEGREIPDEDESLEGLTRRMRRLQLQLRAHNASHLQRLNAEVRDLQGRVWTRLRGLCTVAGNGAVSVAQKRHLFLVVAAFMDQSCSDVEQHSSALSPRRGHEDRAPAEAILREALSWMCCLDKAGQVAVFADVRSQAFHLAALLDAAALRRMVEDELIPRLRASLPDAGPSAAAAADGPLDRCHRRILNGLRALLRTEDL